MPVEQLETQGGEGREWDRAASPRACSLALQLGWQTAPFHLMEQEPRCEASSPKVRAETEETPQPCFNAERAFPFPKSQQVSL